MYKIIQLLLLLAIFLQIICQEEDLGYEGSKSIKMKNYIYYIFDIEDNYSINRFNSTKESKGTYSTSFKKPKDIMVIDDNNFVITGINSNNYFMYQIFEILDSDNLRGNSVISTRLRLENIRQLNGRILGNNQLILYGIFGLDFIVYKIDLSTSSFSQMIIPNNLGSVSFNNYDTYKNIQCDSYDEDNFFCIITIKVQGTNEEYWKSLYFKGNYNSITNSGNICERDCYFGNIIKIDNKYLVCYNEITLSEILSIVCQYYSFERNNIIIGEGYETAKFTATKVSEKPLILHSYKDSIFIDVDFESKSIYSFFIQSSFDFKINIKSYIVSGHSEGINFFNDDNYIYFLYEFNDDSKTTTFMKKTSILSCNVDTVNIANNNVNVNFYEGHTNNQKIAFSLDKNTKLYKGSQVIGSTLDNYISLDTDEKFVFQRINNIGVFWNYYAYVIIRENNGISQSFSLICPLKLVICPESCESCDPTKNVSSVNHFCTKCNNEYYPISGESSSQTTFNCYSTTDEKIINYYYLNNGVFNHCDNSCQTCINSHSCRKCKEGYYFMSDQNNKVNNSDICYNSTSLPEVSYYLDYISNINQFVYKKCYDTCLTCNTYGTKQSNNCLQCKSGKKYAFSEYQCTTDSDTCIKNSNFWTFKDNNVECISKCDDYLILYGNNKGQCVESCQNFVNPYSISSSSYLYSLNNCGEQKYCITLDVCLTGFFYITYETQTCEKIGKCEIDFFNYNDSLVDPPIDDDSTEPVNEDEKKEDIKNRLKIIKINSENHNYAKNNYDLSLITNYLKLLKEESPSYLPNKIFLLTSTQYLNYIITIYPIDIEEYAYEKIFKLNNLGFVNFNKLFPEYINYEINKDRLILAVILENKAQNSSINDINYFLYSFNEKSNEDANIRNLLNIKELVGDVQIEIQYPLFNYYNQNYSFINKRNSENLVNNIKNLSETYPDIDVSNKSDPFFNDICFLFTTDVGTDMTIQDRRNEYYVSASLCEDNCTTIKIINKNINPRALCNCQIKSYYTLNPHNDIKDELKSHSVPNSRSFVCGTISFSPYISKNGIFWIFIIIFIFQIVILVRYVLYRKKEINKILGVHEKSEGDKVSSSDSSSFESKKNNEHIEVSNKNKNNSSNLNNNNESDGDENLSAPVNSSNPPRKRVIKKNYNSSTREDAKINDKDLISKNESSYSKISYNKYGGKTNQDFTDISFDDIYNEEDQYYIDNLLKQRNMLKNNFLDNPIFLERLKKFAKIKKALRPLSQKKFKKYYNTCEDILYPYQNQNKLEIKKNRKIAKLLGGEDILERDLIQNYSDCENNPRYPQTKIANKKKDKNTDKDNNNFIFEEEKGFLADEQIIFSGGLFKEGDNFLIDNDNNKKQSLIKEQIYNNLENEENKKSNKNINKNNNKNTLSKSIGKKEDFNKKKEDQKKGDKDERLKTDIENDAKNKIKKELVKIGKGEARPNSGLGIFGKKKLRNNHANNKRMNNNKFNSSIESDSKALMKSSTIQPLKLREKNHNKKNMNKNNNNSDNINNNLNDNFNDNINDNFNDNISNNNNKDISKEKDSNRILVNFQEEGELNGDNNPQNLEEDQFNKRRSKNLEILNEKNMVSSSVSEFLEKKNKDSNLINENFLLFFWRYFIKRELGYVCIEGTKKSIPYFVRYSCFAFSISFIFLLNCFLFLESAVHKRYINALSGKRNRLGYYFRKEFGMTCCVALLSNLYKILIVKLLLYKLFKIGKKVKKMMKPSSEKALNQDELLLLKVKRQKFLNEYNRNLMIHFIVLMGLTVLISYICICYGGVFPNSIGAFIWGFIFSLILCYIFCAVVCFIIVCIYKLGKYLNNKCVISAYIVLSTLY